MSQINWADIRSKLPFEATPEAKARRAKLFRQFDPNGNGYLSLAEVDKGIRDVLHLDAVFDCKPAVNRAFHAARKLAPSKTKQSDDYLTLPEFRVFLQYLRQYFEMWQAFSKIAGADRRISLDEFVKAQGELARMGVQIADPKKTFAEIDANGGGSIMFEEFCDWAIPRGLDLEDDDE
jgi:Ca2+-binding EF-hand superfamily protein